MKKLILFLFLFTIQVFSQSYHTINIDGNNDFNTAYERFNTSSTNYYSYLTWDESNLYLGYSGEDVGSNQSDLKWIVFYIDTDPQSNLAAGNGTSNAIGFNTQNWSLPFNADYMIQIRTTTGFDRLKKYEGSSWNDVFNNFQIYDNDAINFIEIKLPLSDIGNPKQIKILGYFIDETSGDERTYAAFPNNSISNGYYSSGSFSTYYNFLLIDQVYPNLWKNNNNYQWAIRLKASVAGLSDTTTWAGMGLNYINGRDSLVDHANAPVPPSNYIEMYFPHSDWTYTLGPNYSRDFKKLVSLDSTTSSWDFTVNTDRTNAAVTISADNFDFIPSNYNVFIYDIAADSTHDIKSSNYIYNSGTLEVIKNFNLIIGVSLASQNISVSHDSLKFGSVKINRDSIINLTVFNTGDSILSISNITSSLPVYTFTGGTTYNIAGNSSVVIPVKFRPTANNTYNGTLTIFSNDIDEPQKQVAMTGTGVNLFPEISSSTSSLNFGPVKVDYDSTISFKIYNTGDTTLNVTNISNGNSAFSVTTSSSFSVLKNDSAEVSVKFTPAAVASYNDTLKLTNNDPDEGTFTVLLSGSGIISTLENAVSAGWNLISIPVEPEDPSASAVIGDDINPFFLYNYSNSGGYFTEDTLETGRGYWLGVENSFTLDVTGTPRTSDVSVAANSGWNIVASPFVRKYLASQVYFNRGGSNVNAAAAISSGWIQANTYYGYGSSYSAKDTLAQWSGYWFATLTDSVNLVFFHDSTSGTPLRLNPDGGIESTVENWAATITAKLGSVEDNLLTFGASEFATDGFDTKYDLAKPPVSPASEAVQTYFSYSNWSQLFTKYAGDIKQAYQNPMPGKSWSFNAYSKTAGDLILSWNNIISEIPEEIRNYYKFELAGPGISSSINMLSSLSYTVNILAGEILTFHINSTPVSAGDTGPLNFKYELSQNYPNPFNPATIISYQIADAGIVNIVVYNSLGEQVSQLLNEYKNAGSYQVKFDGSRLSSGIYYYKISAGDFVEVRKMVILK